MSAGYPAKKNDASGFTFSVGLTDGTSILANPTLAEGDVKVSIDNGTLNNLGTLPVVTPASSGIVLVTLSQAETNGDDIIVKFIDAAGAEWKDLLLHIKTSTDQIDDLATPAEVNTQVLDVLNTDTFGEPGQEAPGVTVSLVTKIGYLYKAFRNKITQDSSTLKIFADDETTVDQTSAVSDDTTTFTRGEMGTGP
jgi:hypothetical protein